MKSGIPTLGLLAWMLTLSACTTPPGDQAPAGAPYDTTWASLTRHPEAEWFHDAKFGIYTHWGVYSVPAYGNEWYPRWMYAKDRPDERHFYAHHLATFGDPTRFGYKDFVPMFTAEKFDAEEWAALFEAAGAKFAGPVAEHHDGFALWDSDLTEWDAADMGPQRDILGELAKALRNRGLKLVTSFHHAQNWWHYEDSYALGSVDTRDTAYAGVGKIYPPPHRVGDRPTTAYLVQWEQKVREVIDKYQPDYMWFDFGWAQPEFEPYKRSLLAYYYNHEPVWGRQLVVTYKHDHLPTGAGILDLERGKIDSLTAFKWITDTSIAYNSWCYTTDLQYNTLNTLVDNLVDRVSKNGSLLLNVAPRSDGSIPQEQKDLLLAMGAWLKANGEAIYGTRPWVTFGEGPTRHASGQFTEQGVEEYTAEDVRFTRKGDTLYAIALARPSDGRVVVKSLADGSTRLPAPITGVSLLGVDAPVSFERSAEGLVITMPAAADPEAPAFAFRIEVDGRL